MTIDKLTTPSLDKGAEALQMKRDQQLGGVADNFFRRHIAQLLQYLESDRRSVNEHYEIDRQRYLAIVLLVSLGLYYAFLSFTLLITGQALESLALLALVAVQIIMVWRQMNANLTWLDLWGLAVSLISLYGYLLLSSAELAGGVLWALVAAPAFFILLGYYWGGLCFIAAFAISIIVFFAPLSAQELISAHLIADEFMAKKHFLGVFLLLGMCSFLLEFERCRVVSSLINSRDNLRVQASTDELTGLANRHRMRECLSQQERRSRQGKERYALILADIDRFKQINDQYGHDCGDYVISAIANALRNALRDEDVVARWGGEEFLVVLPDSDGENARSVAQKLREAIAGLALTYDAQPVFPTLSFGVVSGDQHQEVQDLIRQADHCLYQAKHKGRDCIVYG